MGGCKFSAQRGVCVCVRGSTLFLNLGCCGAVCWASANVGSVTCSQISCMCVGGSGDGGGWGGHI